MAKWHMYVNMVLVLQDEIWSEIVLKRLRTVRERTKEGLFGNVPYSFMTASQSQVHCPFCRKEVVLHACYIQSLSV